MCICAVFFARQGECQKKLTHVTVNLDISQDRLIRSPYAIVYATTRMTEPA